MVHRNLPSRPVNKLPDVAESIFWMAVISTGSAGGSAGPAGATRSVIMSWSWPAPCDSGLFANEAIPGFVP
jgi:hypothetical protein